MKKPAYISRRVVTEVIHERDSKNIIVRINQLQSTIYQLHHNDKMRIMCMFKTRLEGFSMSLGWLNTSQINQAQWKCGYCGVEVGGNVGYKNNEEKNLIYICPSCYKPTAFIIDNNKLHQIPSASFGSIIEHLPPEIHTLYEEIKRCVQYTAYTSAVMAMRKLIMHVAVDKGAQPSQSFINYIDYLDSENWIPKSGKEWVDKVRQSGNQANHEIIIVEKKEAMRLLKFVEMLLQIIYEFPASGNE